MQKTPHTFYRGGDLSSVLLKLIPDVLLNKRGGSETSVFSFARKMPYCLNSDANLKIDMINTCIHTYPLFEHDMI